MTHPEGAFRYSTQIPYIHKVAYNLERSTAVFRVKQQTRIEKQAKGMALVDMIADLPMACDVGTKQNSKGYKESWIGCKLHLDVADGGIPVSGLLTSASTHDSQVAIPWDVDCVRIS